MVIPNPPAPGGIDDFGLPVYGPNNPALDFAEMTDLIAQNNLSGQSTQMILCVASLLSG